MMTEATHTPPTAAPPAPHDLPGLAKDLDGLIVRLRHLSDTDDLIRLLKVIRQPGWTTPAEFALVRGLTTHLTEQLATVERGRALLVRGADLVGRGA